MTPLEEAQIPGAPTQQPDAGDGSEPTSIEDRVRSAAAGWRLPDGEEHRSGDCEAEFLDEVAQALAAQRQQIEGLKAERDTILAEAIEWRDMAQAAQAALKVARSGLSACIDAMVGAPLCEAPSGACLQGWGTALVEAKATVAHLDAMTKGASDAG